MVYAVWLFGISVLFLALERAWPLKKQRLFRTGFLQDLGYLIFNSEYLGVLIGVVAIHLTKMSDPLVTLRWMDGQPLGV
jgi:hypothetical protein